MSDLLVDIGVAAIGGAIAFGLLLHLRATLNKSLAAVIPVLGGLRRCKSSP